MCEWTRNLCIKLVIIKKSVKHVGMPRDWLKYWMTRFWIIRTDSKISCSGKFWPHKITPYNLYVAYYCAIEVQDLYPACLNTVIFLFSIIIPYARSWWRPWTSGTFMYICCTNKPGRKRRERGYPPVATDKDSVKFEENKFCAVSFRWTFRL